MQYVCPIPPAEPKEFIDFCDRMRLRSHFLRRMNVRFRSSPADQELIVKSLDCFTKLFKGVRRRSGQSFMHGHLLPTAGLIMDYWEIQDAPLVAAALGHDAIEDFKWVTKALVAEWTDNEVAHLVAGVTKPPREGLRKNSVEYARITLDVVEVGGPRCVFLKTQADRPHSISTLWGTPERKRWKLWETEQYYVPLARKYGFPVTELQALIRQQRLRLNIDDNAP